MADDALVPSLDAGIDKFVEGLFDPKKLARLERAIRNAHAEGATVAHAAQFKAGTELATDTKGATERVKEIGEAIAGWFISLVVEHAFDVEIDNVEAGRIAGSRGRKAVARLITNKMIEALTGGSKSVEASPQPAANYLSVIFGQVFEAWAIGEITEIATAYIPFIEKVEHVADLGDKVVQALGISDSSARVLRPYIDNLVVEPLRRYIASTYRPALLTESMAVRQYLRGTWTRSQLDHELAEQGWDPDRIEAQINNARKFLSFNDAMRLARGGGWTRADVVQHLRDQGLDEKTAWMQVDVDRRERLDAIWGRALTPALSAYANREIPAGDLKNLLVAILEDDEERELAAHIGDTLRALRVTHLSHGEIIEMVELGIATVSDYREWLGREGYPEREATMLELRLKVRIQKDRDVEDHRRALDQERTAEKAAREAAAQQKATELEQQHALARRGSLADLRRAAVRGLIPLARVEEILTPLYDADTVAIYMDLIEQDRADYVTAQTERDEARKRAETKHIDVGALDAAVLAGVLTLDEFAAGARARGIVDADVAILTATLAARKRDLDDARRKRVEAEAAAARRGIDLTRFEALVRRGHRSFADYDALLTSLRFDEAARAAMRELLELQIADDTAARELREAAHARAALKGVTLEQARRAVILGTWTDGQFQTYLVDAGYTPDAQLVLVAELRRDVADAEAARRRRETADTGRGPREVPLATLARAARLGLVTPAVYTDRLRREGYSDDAIALELELLLVEIADTQAARARRDALAAAADDPKALSLAQIEHAVKAGTAPVGEYRGAAAAIYDQADADLLVATLEAELGGLTDARRRRATVAGELQARTLSLTELEAEVMAGRLSLAAFTAQLEAWGYDPADAALVAAALADRMEAA
jgi:hypothetical protein